MLRTDHTALFELALLESRTGAKPVTKLELRREDGARGILTSMGIEHALVQPVREGGEEIDEVFLGVDPPSIREAARLTEATRSAWQDSASGRADWLQSMRALGQLLGYPPCCVEAFAIQTLDHADDEGEAWLHLARRINHVGACAPELNPWGHLLEYVPCTLACHASLNKTPARVRAMDDVGIGPPDPGNPWLAYMGNGFPAFELIPRGLVGARFPYRVGRRKSSDDELAAWLDEATELSLEDGRLRLLAPGPRVVTDLSARAFVWWHEAQLVPDELRERHRRRLAEERHPMWTPDRGSSLSVDVVLDDGREVTVPRALLAARDKLLTLAATSQHLRVTDVSLRDPAYVSVRLEAGERACTYRVHHGSRHGSYEILLGDLTLTHDAQRDESTLGAPQRAEILMAAREQARAWGISCKAGWSPDTTVALHQRSLTYTLSGLIPALRADMEREGGHLDEAVPGRDGGVFIRLRCGATNVMVHVTTSDRILSAAHKSHRVGRLVLTPATSPIEETMQAQFELTTLLVEALERVLRCVQRTREA
jgi:hypothetical protein